MKAYISGALQGARDLGVARAKYQRAAELLKLRGFVPYLPHERTDPIENSTINSKDVFLRDVEELLESDVIVAFIDEPSLGVGAEIALALGKGKKVYALRHKNVPSSRFIVGMIESNRCGEVIEYDQLEGAVNAIVVRQS